MSTTRIARWLSVATLALAAAGFATIAPAQTFQVVSVNTLGCNSGNFGMTVERAGLDGGSYTVRTVVTVGAFVYMNENATISVNGLSGWNIFDNFTYGPVPNQGTYPIPSGQTMTLDFSLERPVGNILYRWRLVVDGCDTGNILSNGSIPVGSVPVPLPPWGWAAIALMLAGTVAIGRRRLR